MAVQQAENLHEEHASTLRNRKGRRVETSTSSSPQNEDTASDSSVSSSIYKTESRLIIFDSSKYPKEKVYCSHPEKHKIPV